MDKIITIYLGGHSIKMEEEAYEALKPYIRQIEETFANTENGKEIINDIEARIAEMLIERTDGKISVSLEDIEFIKKTMGNPVEFEDSNAEEPTKRPDIPSDTVRKRLYRDTDNKIFGGVCSGISNYLNIDPVIVRLIWVFLFFVMGVGFLLYFIMWIIVPEAITTAQKLEMSGEAPTLDNIINRVKSEAGKVEQNLRAQNFGQKITEIFRSISPLFLFFFKIIAFFIGIFLLVILSALLIGLIFGINSLVFNDNGFSIHYIPNVFDVAWQLSTVKLLIALFFGIPLFSILAGLLKFIFNSKVNFRPVRQVLGWVWIAVIPLLIYFVYVGVQNFKSYETLSVEKTEKISAPILIKMTDTFEGNLFESFDILITPSEDSLMHIDYTQSASGKNILNARDMARKNEAGYIYTDNILTLTNSDYFQKTKLFRRQKVVFNIQIPNGKSFTFDKSVQKEEINTIVNGHNISYYANESNKYENPLVFLRNDLFCPTCPDSIPVGSSRALNFSNFERVEVEGYIDVEIKRGTEFRVEKTGSSNIIRHLEINQYGSVLNIDMEDGHFNLKTKPRVIITMPELKSLKLSGASECKLGNFAGESFNFECNGASRATMSVDYSEIQVNMSGAGNLEISGSSKNLNSYLSGASNINAQKLVMETAIIDISGASEIILGTSKSIQGEASGASKVEYLGNPIIKLSTSGVSKIKPYVAGN